MPEVDSIIAGFSIAAALTASCLILFSFDFVSQKILSPEQLYSKRRQEQLYEFDKAIQGSIQKIRQHVNEGQVFSAESEKSIIEVLISDADVHQLVDDIIQSKSVDAPLIIAISKDLSLPTDDFYIFFAFPQASSFQSDGSQRYNRRVQVKLIQFCTFLADGFRKNLSAQNNICFIADASSSLSCRIIGDIIQKCNISIPMVQEKSWMTSITLLIRRGVINSVDAETIMYSLVLLEVYKQSHLLGESNTTVLTLPGQNCVPILLPLLVKVFPNERYIFAYDGCIRSVYHGLALLRTFKPEMNIGNDLPLDAMPRNFTATIPSVPLHQKLSLLPSCLAKLNRTIAGIVESWMASVDTLISLQQDDSGGNFVPFVCKIDHLVGNNEAHSSLSVQNILQFLTGSNYSSINDQIVDAAKSVIQDVKSTLLEEILHLGESKIDIKVHKNIEDCVFVHKMILFSEKTLPDTVEPRERWSLKNSKKLTGCACCLDDAEKEAEYDHPSRNCDFCKFVER